MNDRVPEYLPSIGRMLAFAERQCGLLSERELAPHGLTLAQWVILTALWRNDGLTIGEIVRYSRSSNPVLTRTLDRMTKRGFVVRERDPDDRRVVRIKLTEKGRGLSHLLGFYERINTILVEGFSQDEQQQLMGLLERVAANAAAALERPAPDRSSGE